MAQNYSKVDGMLIIAVKLIIVIVKVLTSAWIHKGIVIYDNVRMLTLLAFFLR